MTKVDLITGILGAGKTTFLLKYAKWLLAQGLRIAVLENDFGAVNADMVLLQELKCENCQLEMISGGCDADCHKRRFRTQMIALGMQHFDRVLIEPSGIFDPDEFFDILHEPPLDRWFEIGSVLAVISAETEAVLTDEMEYLLASEASCAGKLLLSKLPEPDAENRAGQILARLNNALDGIRCDRRFTENDLLTKQWELLNDADFTALSEAGYRNASFIKKYQTDMLRSAVHYFMHISLPVHEIPAVIGSIFKDPECGRVYRIKGSLPNGQGSWLRINATPEKTEMTPAADAQAVLIVIGEQLDRAKIDTYLKAHNTDPEYISI